MRSLIEPHHSLDDIWNIVQRELRKAVSLKRHPFKYVTLSTAHKNEVRSRYVVLRQFLENHHLLVFTDFRSDKITALTSNDQCALLCYHPGKSLQVRINGRVVIHHQNSLTARYWNGVKNHSATSYTSVLAPGEPVSNPTDAWLWTTPATATHFTVLEIIPSRVEVLQLQGDKHIRALFTAAATGFDATFLAP